MTIRELTESDWHAWNEFVGWNPYGDTLQAWEWGLVKADGGDWRPIRIAAFSPDGDIVAGVSILARRIPVVGTIYYAPRGPVMANWGDEALLGDLVDAIKARARVDNAVLLKIDPAIPSGQADRLSALRRIGFQHPADQDAQGFGGTQPRAVMVLTIAGKSDEELMAGFKPMCRRNIRIAEKKGVVVATGLTREHLGQFHDLLLVTARRDGFTVRPRRYFEALWDNLVENGMGRLFLTEFEGRYLSGALCFLTGDKCVYVYGASSNDNRNVMPNYAMQWAMIRWARDSGCKTYDFRGVAPVKPGEDPAGETEHLQGLNRFKEGFGAEFVEYIGELDLPLDAARYWLWSRGKPAAQGLLRRVRTGLGGSSTRPKMAVAQ
jgi:lipid II:glycine glycyltransferase (peptidoglycan interpeptide bridge formation enzyme)